MLQHKVLISKLGAIYALSPCSVSPCEVSTLAHELGNDPVKRRTLEVQGLSETSCAAFASAQTSEVLYCLWCNVRTKLHHYAPSWLSMQLYIKVNTRKVCHGRKTSSSRAAALAVESLQAKPQLYAWLQV
jgi:hypothetical protein